MACRYPGADLKRKSETGRHHADDRELLAIDQGRTAGDGRIGAEAVAPERIGENEHALSSGRVRVRVRVRPRAAGTPATSKNAPETIAPSTPFGGARGADVERRARISRKCREAGGAPRPVEEHARRQASANQDAVGFGIGQRTEERCLHHREDRRVGADPERHRRDHRGREYRRGDDPAPRVSHVLHHMQEDSRPELRHQHGELVPGPVGHRITCAA